MGGSAIAKGEWIDYMLNREEELRFCKARRAAIELEFQNLNREQRQAVLATEGRCCCWPGRAAARPRCSSTASPT